MEANSDEALRSAVWEVADALGLSEFFIPDVRYSIMDGHTLGIPIVDIIGFDYETWHSADDAGSVSPKRVGRVLERFLEAVVQIL